MYNLSNNFFNQLDRWKYQAYIRDADWEKYWPEAKKWLYHQEYRETFHLENDKEIIKDQQEQINK